jgi:hypothetical protein
MTAATLKWLSGAKYVILRLTINTNTYNGQLDNEVGITNEMRKTNRIFITSGIIEIAKCKPHVRFEVSRR